MTIAVVARRFSPHCPTTCRSQRQTDEVELWTTRSMCLIATDVLSEGQNLQDSHVVVNYDLPWAIIRSDPASGKS
jgi:superfamily II DNA/RNA helicase